MDIYNKFYINVIYVIEKGNMLCDKDSFALNGTKTFSRYSCNLMNTYNFYE